MTYRIPGLIVINEFRLLQIFDAVIAQILRQGDLRTGHRLRLRVIKFCQTLQVKTVSSPAPLVFLESRIEIVSDSEREFDELYEVLRVEYLCHMRTPNKS